jgi:hypothetical protein
VSARWHDHRASARVALALQAQPERLERETPMTRALLMFAVLLGLGMVSSVAMAQDKEGDLKTKFYDFDDMLIDGELKKPEGLVFKAQEKAKFDRLLSLKKSFLPRIEESAKEDALK